MARTQDRSHDRSDGRPDDRSTGRPDRRTRGGTRPRMRDRAARAALCRDVPCTVAILTGHEDFAAMRHYTTFPFTDYHRYLHHVEHLLRTLRTRGLHVRATAFDPARYSDFCTETGLEPDAPVSRARYAADAAGPGAAVHYQGEPIGELVQAVLQGAERHTTRAQATAVLDASEIGAAAFDHMAQSLTALLERAGPGTHHIVASAFLGGRTPLLAVLHATSHRDTVHAPEDDAALLCTVLAAGLAAGTGGGAVLRTLAGPGGRDTVRGWSLRGGGLQPLTAAEVFDAYCTDHRTGEPIAPEPGVDYEAGFPLTDGEP
jgi:hypothetical protein